MAGRVNTRFVFILAAVLVVLVGGLAVVAYRATRDAQELVARGEQYLQEGQYDEAIETLQRAVNRSKSDPAVIKKLIHALEVVPADDHVEATNAMQLVRQWTLNLAQINPDSEETLKEYADLIERFAERVRTDGGVHPFFNYTYQAALARLEYNPEDRLARRYRAVYGLLFLNEEMSQQDIDKVRDDIHWAYETFPDDPEVVYGMAKWKLFDADRQSKPGGDPDKAKQLRDEAVAMMKALVDADPNNNRKRLDYIQVLYRATLPDTVGQEDRFAPIRPALEELEARLLEDPAPFDVVSTTINFLKSVYARPVGSEDAGTEQPTAENEGTGRAIALLERALEVYPDDPRYKLMLGIELKLASDFEQARQLLEEVRSLSTTGDYLDVLLHYTLKTTADVEYADLLITLAELADSKDKADAMRAEAGRIIEQIAATGRGEEPRILLLKGRLALSQKKLREGLIYVDKAAEKYDAFSREKAEAYLLSARARAQQGDWGAAAERYEQIIKVNPNVPQIRLTLAQIYIRQHEFDKAQDHIDAVLMDYPNSERAVVMQATLYAAQGDLDRAIETYKQLDLPNRPDLAVGLAQLMIQGGRAEQARAMLQHYFDADPTNLAVLSVLLTVVEDDQTKQQLIDTARTAGADTASLDRLAMQLDPEVTGNLDKAIEVLLQDQEDPYVREIQTARLYAQAGQQDKAREALARAEKLNPDDKAVLDMQFAFALQDGDMELAQKLADKAAQLNLDEAQGRFYYAQILSHKKDYAGAIEQLKFGLADVPINSEGWRLLGDMYVAVKNDTEALSAFETALKQKPDNLGAMRGLAAIRDRQGRHDEALAMLRRAHLQYPNNTALLELYLNYEGRYGDKQAALAKRRALLEAQPDNDRNVRSLAVLLAETGQVEEAEKLIDSLIETQGQTIENVMAQAGVYKAAGDAARGAQVLRAYLASRGDEASAQDYLILARYLFTAGDGPGALTAYQQAIALESEQREATRELAALYFARGAFDRAVPLYRDLHASFPEEEDLSVRFADALIRVGEFDEAAQVLDTVDGGATEDALQALIAQARGDNERAIQLVNRAIEADPTRAVFYYERAALMSQDPENSGQVINDLNKALSLDPNHQLSRQLLVAMYQRQGERREALRELTTLVTRHPDNKQARLALIRMLVQDGDLVGAKRLAQAGVELAPSDPTWPQTLGDIAMREGDTDAAITHYAKVFELSPNPVQLMRVATIQIENGKAADAQQLLRDNADLVNAQPLLQAVMGRALYAQGRTDEATQVFSRAAERCSNVEQFISVAAQIREDFTFEQTASLLQGLSAVPNPAWIELALARLEIADKRIQDAVNRLVALEPRLSAEDENERRVLDLTLGPALHQLGKPNEALAYYQRSLESMPDNVSIMNNMAYLLAEDLNRPAEALPLAERANEQQPGNAQILDTLGWVQFKLGQLDEARRHLEASIEAEDLAANHLHLAELLLQEGYRVEAQRHLQMAVDLAEQNNDTLILQRARELLEQSDELTEANVTP